MKRLDSVNAGVEAGPNIWAQRRWRRVGAGRLISPPGRALCIKAPLIVQHILRLVCLGPASDAREIEIALLGPSVGLV